MGTKHLTEADRLRARQLFFDSGLAKSRICQLTGFSLNQVKLAIREKTPKSRCGRPPRRRAGTLIAGALNSATGNGNLSTGYMPEHDAGMVHMGMPPVGSDGSLGHASGTMPEATGMESHASSLHHPQHHHHHIQPPHHQHHPQQPLPQLQHHHHHQEQHHQQHPQSHPHHQSHHQPQHVHQDHHAHQDHHSASIRKWEPEYSPTNVYAWTSHPQQPSTPSTVSSVSTHYGHYGRALSPPAPTHVSNSTPSSGPPLVGLRAPSSSSSSSSLLGIHSLAGYDRPYHDGHSSTSSQHGLSSMSSSMSTSSLASSATSYSSMSPSPSGISTSSVGVHGGFSLPAILATSVRP